MRGQPFDPGRARAAGVDVSGPHLHFEVGVTPQFGSGTDPLPWLQARGVGGCAPSDQGRADR
ncbi:hypothetical protein DXZ75_16440 [Streptomyces sp. AcE210]|nr:hypothetical protein DXZ75_16440 [Streptomyces sp. AcE210]